MKKFLLVMLIICTINCFAQQNISNIIEQKSIAIQTKLVDWRRSIHQHPELGNREFNTEKFIADHLKALGIEVKTGVAKTGVIGILKGDKPGPVIALRSDMDALPIKERVDLSFKSTDSSEYLGQKVPVM